MNTMMRKLLMILMICALFGFSTASESEMPSKMQLLLAELSPEEKEEVLEDLLETGSCEYEGVKLYGKVKFVTSFPDIKIQYVNSFPDIKVKFVTSFPDDCGEWQQVNSFPDFKVQIVESFPDIKVKVVDSFPGM